MVPYTVPQAWARAFAAVDLEGVRYAPGFTTGPALAVALFGTAGDAGWPVDAAPLAGGRRPGRAPGDAGAPADGPDRGAAAAHPHPAPG